MKIHRFIDSSFNLDSGSLVVTNPEIVNQWVNVLRFKISDKLVVCDGAGFESQATIVKISTDTVELLLDGKTKNQNEPSRQVYLYCAVLKKENFELVVQKSIETGVTKIIPIKTERTIKQNLRVDRLQKIAQEAAEQSGRGIVPEIAGVMDFAPALAEAVSRGETFLFDLTASKMFTEKSPSKDLVNIFIGPEGGFSETEVAQAKESSAQISSLGRLTLRAETAAIVATWASANV